MRLDSLKHIALAVRAMLDGDRLIVFGSASLLAKFPELGEVDGSPLLRTYDADIIPYPFEEEVGMMLDESFGEERVFHQRFGYYADIVRPRVTETFPKNWESRLISLDGVDSVFCLDPHDMAAAKCLVGRDKDRNQLIYLLNEGYLDPLILKSRVEELELVPKMIIKVHRVLDELLEVASS